MINFVKIAYSFLIKRLRLNLRRDLEFVFVIYQPQARNIYIKPDGPWFAKIGCVDNTSDFALKPQKIRVLKTRIVPVLLFRDGLLVKGRQFNSWRRIGPPIPAVRVMDRRNVDELVFLDIGATPEEREPDFELIEEVASEVYSPLTVGGGVSHVSHFRELLRVGADKVSVNTAAVNDPSLLETAARKFGSQCVTVSIDVLEGKVATGCGSLLHDLSPISWARECERLGAGEILLNSVERDGTLGGYDLDLIQSVSNAVNIPVVACGGCGSFEDMALALNHAHAVAAGALFAFTECTPIQAARYLASRGYPTRVECSDNGRERIFRNRINT